jgi:methylated-DNA-[protein]-cysteine S-methyltransferase
MIRKVKIEHPLTDVVLFGVIRSGETAVSRIELAGQDYEDKVSCGTDEKLIRYGHMIYDFLDGRQRDLLSIPLVMDDCTDFSWKVLETARKIRWGETISYSELARRAGYPGAVRAAASVMRKNRFPLVIPCHRVVRSDGTSGGYCGMKSGAAVELKKRLLELEQMFTSEMKM